MCIPTLDLSAYLFSLCCSLVIAVQSTKRQLAVVFNFIVTIAAAFVFGYYCGKWLFSGDFLTVSHL